MRPKSIPFVAVPVQPVSTDSTGAATDAASSGRFWVLICKLAE